MRRTVLLLTVITILIVAGCSLDNDIPYANGFGAYDYLSKPLDMDDWLSQRLILW